MRFYLIYFLFLGTSSFGQIEVQLFFANSCDSSVTRLEFELDNAYDSASTHSKNGIAAVRFEGTYNVTAYQALADDRIGFCYYTIDITGGPTFVDTLSIPRIKFITNRSMDFRYWNYFNCDKLCEGRESEVYPAGQKRLDGEFKGGKPNYVTEYRMDGTKETTYWYVPGTLFYKRVDYFDLSGNLEKYEKYKNKKHRKVVTTYTAQGEEIGKRSFKNEIEK